MLFELNGPLEIGTNKYIFLFFVSFLSTALGSHLNDALSILTITVSTSETFSKSPSIMHMACFEDGNNEVTSSMSTEDCCMSLLENMEGICKIEELSRSLSQQSCSEYNQRVTRDQTNNYENWQQYQYCIQRIAPVPDVKKDIKNNNEQILSPRYYLFFSSEDDSYESDTSTAVKQNKIEKGLFHQYTFDMKSAKPIDDGFVFSPFHLIFSSLSTQKEKNLHQKNPVVGRVKGKMESEISSVGGMHRQYLHEITLFVESNDEQSKDLPRGRLSGTVTFLLPIHEGLFLDIDMPFEEERDDACRIKYSVPNLSQENETQLASCFVDLLVEPDSVIDIEQPSFVSPQHVLKFQASFDIDLKDVSSSDLSIKLNFGTTIHMRYPLAINKENTRDDAGTIYFPSPSIYDSVIHIENSQSQVSSSKQSYVLDTTSLNDEMSNEVLHLKIAAGINDDHDFVAIITFLASVLGAFIMLRDLSKITVWC